MEDGELAVPAGPGTRPKRDEGVGGRGQHPRGGGAAREKLLTVFTWVTWMWSLVVRLLGAPVTRVVCTVTKILPPRPLPLVADTQAGRVVRWCGMVRGESLSPFWAAGRALEDVGFVGRADPNSRLWPRPSQHPRERQPLRERDLMPSARAATAQAHSMHEQKWLHP